MLKNVLTLPSIAALVLMTSAHAAERLPAIPPDKCSAEQTKAAQDFQAARKVPVFGPLELLMHSPEVMSQVRAMGDYLRYHSAIGNALSELVILITAWEWSQDYEWYVHHPTALKAGIKPGIAGAIADGRRPTGMNEDEETVYGFAMELIRNKRVFDQTYTRAERQFGNKGIVDMAGICGYYTLLAMEMNVAQYPAPKSAAKLARFPESWPLCHRSRTARSYDTAQGERWFFAVIKGPPVYGPSFLVFVAIDWSMSAKRAIYEKTDWIS